VKLGSRMAGPHSGVWYPVLSGLNIGDNVVAAGSFLVDAETRLNPAAGSIYFGGTGGGGSKTASTVRPSTPVDQQETRTAAIARLSAEDRKLVEAQRYCPILSNNLLGVMGEPVKLMIEGQPVFLCCTGCKEEALADARKTLSKVESAKQKAANELAKKDTSASAAGEAKGEPATMPATGDRAAPTLSTKANDEKEAKIAAALAKLPAADRKLAEQQKFCAVLGEESRLGSMGPPVKLMLENQPVFVCCSGCREDALKEPKAVLAKAASLRKANGAK
jgi:membrane fusion protein, copper/silver efflux system